MLPHAARLARSLTLALLVLAASVAPAHAALPITFDSLAVGATVESQFTSSDGVTFLSTGATG